MSIVGKVANDAFEKVIKPYLLVVRVGYPPIASSLLIVYYLILKFSEP
jgi:hypothetical protein